MDPQVLQDFEDQLKQSTALLASQNTMMSSILGSMQAQAGATRTSTTSQTQNTTSQTQNTAATRLSAASASAAAIQLDAVAEAAKHFDAAVGASGKALTNFVGSMLSANGGMAKYGNAVDSAGDAALSLGKSFGPLGIAIGAVIKAFTMLAGDALKLTDQLVTFRDETTKTVGVMPASLEQIEKLGREARFSGENLAKLQKITTGLGTSLVGLGGNAGAGAVKFMEMANVSDDVRRKFGRLGVSQEELTNMQAKYVEQQASSGLAYEMQNKSVGQLKKESLAYAENMMRLSSLTGKSADALQKEQDQTMMAFEEQMKVRQENVKIKELEKAGKMEEAAALRTEQTVRQNIMKEAASRLGPEMAGQIGRVIRTGAYDNITGPLATLGVDFQKLSKDVKSGGPMTKEQAEKYSKGLYNTMQDGVNSGVDKFATNLGDAAQFGGEEMAKQFGVSGQLLEKTSATFGKTAEQQDKIVADQTAKAAADAAKKGSLAEAEEKRRSVEREMQAKYQEQLGKLAGVVLPMLTGAMEFLNKAVSLIIDVSKPLIDGYIKLESVFIAPMLAAGGLIAKNWDMIASVGTDLLKVFMIPMTTVGKLVADNWGKISNGFKTGASYMEKFFGAIGKLLEKFGKFLGVGKVVDAAKKGLHSAAGITDKNVAAISKSGMKEDITKAAISVYNKAQASNAKNFDTIKGRVTSGGEPGNKKALTGQEFGPALAANLEQLKKSGQFDAKTAGLASANLGIDFKSLKNNIALGDAQLTGMPGVKMPGMGVDAKILESNSGLKKSTIEQTKQLTDLASASKTESNVTDNQTRVLAANTKALYMLMNSLHSAAGAFSAGGTGGGGGGGGGISVGGQAGGRTSSSGGSSGGGGGGGGIGGMIGGAMSSLGSMTSGAARFVGQEASSLGAMAAGGLGKAGAGLAGLGSKALSGVGKFASTALGSMGNWVMDMIAGNEGARTRPYRDSLGLWTVGVGHLIGDGKTLPPEMNREFSKKEIQEMYKKDFDHHAAAAARIPGFDKMNDKGKAGLIDLTFNMGPAWYKKWPNTVKALEAGDTEGAASGLENSKWYKQVGNRAARTVDLIRQGGVGGGVHAAKGGVFEGPKAGYPATLHGTEMVAPLNVDSILMKLAKTPVSAVSSMTDIVSKSTENTVKTESSSPLNAEFINLLASKLDMMINVLENGNDTQSKILRNSQV